MSKYPCFTSRVVQGTVTLRNLVCTTGAFTPDIVSGKEEKSESKSR